MLGLKLNHVSKMGHWYIRYLSLGFEWFWWSDFEIWYTVQLNVIRCFFQHRNDIRCNLSSRETLQTKPSHSIFGALFKRLNQSKCVARVLLLVTLLAWCRFMTIAAVYGCYDPEGFSYHFKLADELHGILNTCKRKNMETYSALLALFEWIPLMNYGFPA